MDEITNVVNVVERISKTNKQLGNKLIEIQNTIDKLEEDEKRLYETNKKFLAFCQTILSQIKGGEEK